MFHRNVEDGVVVCTAKTTPSSGFCIYVPNNLTFIPIRSTVSPPTLASFESVYKALNASLTHRQKRAQIKTSVKEH